MFGCEGGDARPNNEDKKYGRGDRAQNDVVLRHVGGAKEGSGSVASLSEYCESFIGFQNPSGSSSGERGINSGSWKVQADYTWLWVHGTSKGMAWL